MHRPFALSISLSTLCILLFLTTVAECAPYKRNDLTKGLLDSDKQPPPQVRRDLDRDNLLASVAVPQAEIKRDTMFSEGSNMVRIGLPETKRSAEEEGGVIQERQSWPEKVAEALVVRSPLHVLDLGKWGCKPAKPKGNYPPFFRRALKREELDRRYTLMDCRNTKTGGERHDKKKSKEKQDGRSLEESGGEESIKRSQREERMEERRASSDSDPALLSTL